MIPCVTICTLILPLAFSKPQILTTRWWDRKGGPGNVQSLIWWPSFYFSIPPSHRCYWARNQQSKIRYSMGRWGRWAGPESFGPRSPEPLQTHAFWNQSVLYTKLSWVTLERRQKDLWAKSPQPTSCQRKEMHVFEDKIYDPITLMYYFVVEFENEVIDATLLLSPVRSIWVAMNVSLKLKKVV